MGSATDVRPKCLVELRGQPLLQWQLAALRGGGVSEVALVVGYRAELLRPFGLPVFEAVRWAETNMVRSLMSAAAWLRAGPVVVSYGDIFYSPQTVAALRHAPGELAIAFDPQWETLWRARFSDPLADAESFSRDGAGWLEDIGRKPVAAHEIHGQYMGLLRFTPASWARVEAHLATLEPGAVDRLDMTTLLRQLLAAGERIATVACVGPWGEVDNQDDLALYERDARFFEVLGGAGGSRAGAAP